MDDLLIPVMCVGSEWLEHTPLVSRLMREGWQIVGPLEESPTYGVVDGKPVTTFTTRARLRWAGNSGALDAWKGIQQYRVPRKEDAKVEVKPVAPKTISEETKEQFDEHFTNVFKGWSENNHLNGGIETDMLRVMAKSFYAAGFRKAARIAINRSQKHFEQMIQIGSFEDGGWL